MDSPNSPQHSTQRLKVLLVEDSELVTEQVTLLLQQLTVPVEIRSTQTFDTAISISARFEPDVAIVDLQLTSGSGFSVLRVLANSTPRPTIVVLTNYGLPQYREFALLNGANYFLDKASEFELLNGIVGMLAQQKILSAVSKGFPNAEAADPDPDLSLAITR